MVEVSKKGNEKTIAKKVRRGVSNSTRAVAQLKFHEKDAASNGLFIGHLADVTVTTTTNADGKIFTGMAVPHLTFHFASNHANVNEQRHVYQTLFPVESNVDTIPNGSKEWQVNNVLNWIKHILDVFYLKGRELTEEEEDALALDFVDFDEDNNWVSVDAEEVLKSYKKVFDNCAAMLNGSFNLEEGAVAKPCFKTEDGKFIHCWIKLLRHRKNKNGWQNVGVNGELSFDNFIGNGAVELVKGQNPPAILRIDLSRESITPKETKKQPSIGIPGVPQVPNTGVGAMPMDGVPAGDAFATAGSDMPF